MLTFAAALLGFVGFGVFVWLVAWYAAGGLFKATVAEALATLLMTAFLWPVLLMVLLADEFSEGK